VGLQCSNNKVCPELYRLNDVISRIHVVQEVRHVAEKTVVATKEWVHRGNFRRRVGDREGRSRQDSQL